VPDACSVFVLIPTEGLGEVDSRPTGGAGELVVPDACAGVGAIPAEDPGKVDCWTTGGAEGEDSTESSRKGSDCIRV
jgi:hypothetical protein